MVRTHFKTLRIDFIGAGTHFSEQYSSIMVAIPQTPVLPTLLYLYLASLAPDPVHFWKEMIVQIIFDKTVYLIIVQFLGPSICDERQNLRYFLQLIFK